ncbi:ABC transporter ATP-binding protein [Rhizobium leguminosarum]|uniref:ABC transporter ATP-binding protein n=1 Tax=Rhizobium leguminosarum TaxID=384 RepID=UPI00161BEF02|nr:ABC transporter ATP-binding protein [Rhizobium leguminosarum]MBB4342994.1 ATP-binding cassette subfamily B protein [Rhizobium leguminosarum]MBB6296072.1 ATP-binding cassette subfamily B protein [Rhizobium leguminosarum]
MGSKGEIVLLHQHTRKLLNNPILDAAVSRWRIIQLLMATAPWTAAAVAFFNLLTGTLPVLFVIANSIVLARIGSFAGSSNDAAANSWVPVMVPLLMSIAVFGAYQVLITLQAPLSEWIARRVDHGVFQRVMTAALRPTGIAVLEDQDVRDELDEAVRELEFSIQSPGRAAAGLLALTVRYTQLVGYILVIWWAFSWLAALGTAATCLMFRYGQRGGLRRYSKVFRAVARSRRKSQYLRELALHSTTGKEMRIFGLVGWMTDFYRSTSQTWLKLVWSERRRIYGLPYLWFTAVGVITVGAVLGNLGAYAAGSTPIFELALVLLAVPQAIRLGDFYPEADVQTQYGMNSYQALRAFETRLGADPPADSDLPFMPTESGPLKNQSVIEFHETSFSYPGSGHRVLDSLNLTIQPGKCTAIVGVNGAGKTTLVKLLARLYEPSSGSICIGGSDIRSIPIDEHRRRTSVVFQDFLHHEATVAENIGYGAVEKFDDREGIIQAAADAGLHPAIEQLPSGYETLLASHVKGGVDLSGGQWQRIAIARTLFALRHGASVVILDEPTASLDVRTEASFYHNFTRLARGATTILISHRFATVRHADNIVVIDGGQLIEQGTHEELLQFGGKYATMFREQAVKFTEKF